MGYTTQFTGSFRLTPPLSPAHKAYLLAFANADHMKRDPEMAARLPDPPRQAVGLPVGPDGGYYVGEYFRDDPSVIDFHSQPWGQPNCYCQWIPSEDGTAIAWDGGEKFYDYVEWLEYLIKHFLHRWGYVVKAKLPGKAKR